MELRGIRKIVNGYNTTDGAGVKLVRVLGREDVKDIDPFLMLDAFDSTNPADYEKGFPLHPHRGIETFTYLISGEMDHRDTLGNAGRIKGGEAQWMNSGRGILHEEMPVKSDRLQGLQLWINLPKKNKMTKPTYYDISQEDMPVVKYPNATVRVVAGDYEDISGPKGQFVQPLILDVQLSPDADFTICLARESTLFAYVLEGSGDFGEPAAHVKAHDAVIFQEGDAFYGQAKKEGVRFMLFSGKPLREPIAWAGPIVMNTRQELEQAFHQLEDETFITKE